MKYYIEGLKKYAEFEGRARRKEYWMFILFYFIFTIAAVVLDEILGSEPVIYTVYVLVLILPTLAVTRLHDNRSGWWILITLVPNWCYCVTCFFGLQIADSVLEIVRVRTLKKKKRKTKPLQRHQCNALILAYCDGIYPKADSRPLFTVKKNLV